MPKTRTKFTVAFKRDAEINRPATARRMQQAAEKMLAEQQAAYEARKAIGILGDDAVARTHKWAADARDVVFKDAARTPTYLHPQNFSTLLGFAREMEEGTCEPIALRIAQCPVQECLPNSPATVSGLGMSSMGSLPRERLLGNDFYPFCACTASSQQCPGDPVPSPGSAEGLYIQAAEVVFTAGLFAADLPDLIDHEESIVFGKTAAVHLTGHWVGLKDPEGASPETVELKGGYTSLGIRVKVLPHIIAFLWLPVECIQILKRVLPQPEEDFKEQMTTFIEKAKLLARSAPRWLWDRLTAAVEEKPYDFVKKLVPAAISRSFPTWEEIEDMRADNTVIFGELTSEETLAKEWQAKRDKCGICEMSYTNHLTYLEDGSRICSMCKDKATTDKTCCKCKIQQSNHWCKMNGKDACNPCYRKHLAELEKPCKCAECGEIKPTKVRRSDGKRVCKTCQKKRTEKCVDCKLTKYTIFYHIKKGAPTCEPCYKLGLARKDLLKELDENPEGRKTDRHRAEAPKASASKKPRTMRLTEDMENLDSGASEARAVQPASLQADLAEPDLLERGSQRPEEGEEPLQELGISELFERIGSTQPRTPGSFKGVRLTNPSGKKERVSTEIVIKQKKYYLGTWARAEDAAVAFDLAYLHNKGFSRTQDSDLNFEKKHYMVISKTLEEKSLEDVVNLIQRHATGGKPKRKANTSEFKGVTLAQLNRTPKELQGVLQLWTASVSYTKREENKSQRLTAHGGHWLSEKGAARAADQLLLTRGGTARPTLNFSSGIYDTHALSLLSLQDLARKLQSEATLARRQGAQELKETGELSVDRKECLDAEHLQRVLPTTVDLEPDHAAEDLEPLEPEPAAEDLEPVEPEQPAESDPPLDLDSSSDGEATPVPPPIRRDEMQEAGPSRPEKKQSSLLAFYRRRGEGN